MAGSKRRQTEAEAFEGAGGSDGHFRPHPHPCLHQSLPWNPCTETQPSAQAFLSLCSASREGAPLERKHTTRHMKQAAQKVPSRFLYEISPHCRICRTPHHRPRPRIWARHISEVGKGCSLHLFLYHPTQTLHYWCTSKSTTCPRQEGRWETKHAEPDLRETAKMRQYQEPQGPAQ
jgi:hypothetical protein